VSQFPIFLMRVLRTTVAPEGRRRMHIIVQRPYAYLQDELHRSFVGEADVEVTVDRRTGKRRTRVESVSFDRRRADRRQRVEGIVDVVLS
jgi:hypothetical protein